jgi:hypothetical protein
MGPSPESAGALLDGKVTVVDGVAVGRSVVGATISDGGCTGSSRRGGIMEQ